MTQVHPLQSRLFAISVIILVELKRLNAHMTRHTGEKPFKCDQCDYAAAKSHTLKDHKKIHSDLKPYQCPYCPYRSRQRTPCVLHIKRKRYFNLLNY